MAPVWVYMIGGVLLVWAGILVIFLLVWLLDQYEEATNVMLAFLFTIIVGTIFGKACYDHDLKKELAKTKPPAEATVQP